METTQEVKMKRAAKEAACENIFQLKLQELNCKSIKEYLEKNKIPYIVWDQTYPTKACIVLTADETHTAYFDGTYLWNPNDTCDTDPEPMNEDGLDSWIHPRGFRDFEGGIEDSHNGASVRDGVCFMLCLGYHTILYGQKSSRNRINENRRKLLTYNYREVLSRKVS